MQKRLFDELLEAKKAGIGAGQTLLMVEHPHVYTLGKSGHESNMLVSDEFRVDRGELLPYRPGRGHHLSRIRSVGRLSDFGPRASRTEPQGVCLDCRGVRDTDRGRVRYRGRAARRGDRRLDRGRHAARAQDLRYRGQGFALCDDARVRAERDDDLRYFSYINPCGFVDKGVTSIEKETGARPSLEEVARRFAAHFGELAGCRVSY